MGNDPQKQQQTGAISANINHPKFQNSKVILDGKQKLLQTTMGIDQKQFQKWKNSLKPLNLDSSCLLLPKKQQFDRKGLCGDSGTLKLYYQNYSYLLTEEIYNRGGRKTIFEQPEIWYLLFILSSAQQQIKRKTKGKVGDIRPHNVFLNAQGEAKVSCTFSWPRQNTNFSKTFDNQRTYLSPEDIVRLEMGAMEDTHSFQSEIFSIGLTLLSVGMLEDFLRLYTISSKSYKFNAEEATLLINQWKSNTVYSQILTAVVSNLCEFKPEKRLTDDQLWRWISQFQNEIKQKQDFFIDSAPPKIQQEIQETRQQFPEEQYAQQYEQPPVQTYVQQPIHTYVQQQPAQRFQQPPQAYIHQQLTDKSIVEHYNPPIVHQPEINHLAYCETINAPPKTYEQMFTMQKSPSNQRIVKEQFVPPVNVQSPRVRNSQNVPISLPPQYRQPSIDPNRQAINRFTQQQQNRQAPTFIEEYPIYSNGRYTTPTFVQANLQQNEFKQRKFVSDDPRFANYLPNNPQSSEKQLPPQFVGRTINQTYITKGGQTKTYQQGYIPQHLSPPREQYMPIGRGDNEGSRQTQSLSYFQNVVQGKKEGRIEQTVYIQRPEYNFNSGRQ